MLEAKNWDACIISTLTETEPHRACCAQQLEATQIGIRAQFCVSLMANRYKLLKPFLSKFYLNSAKKSSEILQGILGKMRYFYRKFTLIKKIVAFLNVFMVYYCVTDLKVSEAL